MSGFVFGDPVDCSGFTYNPLLYLKDFKMGSREGSKWELVSLLLLLGAWRLSTIRIEDVIIGANVNMKQILYTIYYIIYTILAVYMQHKKCEHMIIETWMPPGTWRKHKTPSAMLHDRSLPVENPTGILCWNSTIFQAQKKGFKKMTSQPGKWDPMWG